MSTQLKAIAFDSDIAKLTENFTGRQWVFDDIDRWLKESEERFFILTGEPGVGKSAIAARLTQIRDDIAAYHFCRAGDVETVRPARILRSLAAQMGEHLPDYGQALANTIKPVHLRVEVNINIGSMTGSQVTGVYIENLKESDPENELDILIRAPLEELQKMYAEHQKAQPSLAIILIDSLDEAVTTTGATLVKLLTQLSKSTSLPSWVRFIMTSRPERRVLRGFEPLKPYHLREKSDESLADVRQYIEDRVDQPALQDQLQVNQVQPQTLISEITNLSHGNFLYTTLLLNDIEAGRQALDNLAALPKSIDDIYHGFLSRFSEEDWSDRYKPIFGVLTVAQEAISEKEISNFTKIDPEDVRDSIRIARQFFDVELDEQNNETYSIFHQSLRDYLLDEDRNSDFWCNEQKQHQQIIEFCERTSKSWQELERIDAYGRKHLAQHLVKGDRVKDLHVLLSLEQDGKNAWFRVRDGEGDASGFLADIELAWNQAEKMFESTQQGLMIGLQVRYALIAASFKSFASDFPIPIIVALVARKVWSANEGIAYIEKITDPFKRIEATTKLSNFIPDSLKQEANRIREDVVNQILKETSEKYRYRETKLTRLAKIARYTPESLKQLVRQEFTRHFEEIREKANGVSNGPDLNADGSVYYDDEGFTYIASEIADLRDATTTQKWFLENISLSTNDSNPFEIDPASPVSLIDSASQLYDFIESATAEKIDQSRLESLAKTIYFSSEALLELAVKKVLDITRNINDEDHLISFLVETVPYVPEALKEQFLRKLTLLKPSKLKIEMLEKLVDYLSEPLNYEAWNQILENKWIQRAIDKVHCLPKSLQKKAWKQILYSVLDVESQTILEWISSRGEKIRGEGVYTREHLEHLIPHLPKSLKQQALDKLESLIFEEKLEEIDSRLLESFKKQDFRRSFEIAQSIEEVTERIQVIVMLIPSFPKKITQKAFNVIFSIEDTFSRMIGIAKLLPHMEEDLKRQTIQEVLNFIPSISEGNQWTLLKVTIPHLSEILQRQFLPKLLSYEKANAKGYRYETRLHRIKDLIELALSLPESLREKVFQKALKTAIKPTKAAYKQYEALTILLPHLPKSLKKDALPVLNKLADGFALRTNQKNPNLEQLSSISINFDTSLSYPRWCDTLRTSTTKSRSELVANLYILLPIISALGGQEATTELYEAIGCVGRWYP